MSVALLLAEPGKDFPLNNDTVSPGLLGFGVFVVLGVAVFLLLRSMNKQIGRIQAPREADLKQESWERSRAGASGDEPVGAAGNGDRPAEETPED